MTNNTSTPTIEEVNKMVSRDDFRKALIIVAQYCGQIQGILSLSVWQIGCRVELSEWGCEAQGRKKGAGTIIDTYRDERFPKQGTVVVKWDRFKKPEEMHVSQVKPLSINNNQTNQSK